MPAWSGDLTADQVDALAGFILSPVGSQIFAAQCSACHDSPASLVADPQALTDALALGPAFAPHASVEVPNWAETLPAQERTALLNFIAAPDGQRLFAVYCGACHGRSVDFRGQASARPDQPRRLHLRCPRGASV
jgi:mono/diheme cytochrome c family protein